MPLTWERFEDNMTQFFSAWHFDGKTAVRRTVDLQTAGTHFLLIESDQTGSMARLLFLSCNMRANKAGRRCTGWTAMMVGDWA